MCGQVFELPKFFAPAELKILQLLQEGIPICSAPYAWVAQKAGCTEKEVTGLIQKLKNEKIIRRFGASVNHHKAGFRHNALLAWNLEGLSGEVINALGEAAASFKFISHCYLRPSPGPAWPYSLYMMLHAQTQEDFHARVNEVWDLLHNKSPLLLEKPLVLTTLGEYKKSTMNYFKSGVLNA